MGLPAVGLSSLRSSDRTLEFECYPELKINRGQTRGSDPYLFMARPERFELPTTWFEARYSIQLSYGRVRGCN